MGNGRGDKGLIGNGEKPISQEPINKPPPRNKPPFTASLKYFSIFTGLGKSCKFGSRLKDLSHRKKRNIHGAFYSWLSEVYFGF